MSAQRWVAQRPTLLATKGQNQMMRRTDNHAVMQAVHDLGSALWLGGTVMGAAATGYAAYCGTRIGKLAEQIHDRGEKLDVEAATDPTEQTPRELATWQRRQRVTQYVVPVLAAANIACGSYLVQSYRLASTAKGVLRR